MELIKLHNSASNYYRKIALRTIIEFPTTKNILKEIPLVIYEYVPQVNLPLINFNVLIDHIRTHPDLIATRMIDDIILVIQLIQDLMPELHVEQFDYLQIKNQNVSLVRFVRANQNVGRSICVDIEKYRQELIKLYGKEENDYFKYAITGALLAAIVGVYYTNKH